ncbi:hypothetical protein ILUMI_21399 [Ignelater luminosus]|uniref:Uncharacterized protein n=1 Tax=Ignelater luminosus TaxID=2038154 RepID=A0A8K0CGF1_IGNLU|nr:hypothetical protein ILUMI_21399 [Ignelater luminosus]
MFKHVKPLTSESHWPVWNRKIRDHLNYHQEPLHVINGKLVKPAALSQGTTADEIKEHKEKSDLDKKANSYAKSISTSSVTDAVYKRIMDTPTACEVWIALKEQFEVFSGDQQDRTKPDGQTILNWRPKTTTQSIGRPQQRLRDDLVKTLGMGWQQIARDRIA